MSSIIRRNREPMNIAREVFGFDPFTGLGLEWPVARQPGQATFNPRFEVVERDDGYTFKADVPGLKDPDLDVTVQDGQLVVSGTRRAEERKAGDNYFIYERRFGNFTRAFKLPDNADEARVDAALADGVLTIKIGKRESARPRKISLKQP